MLSLPDFTHPITATLSEVEGMKEVLGAFGLEEDINKLVSAIQGLEETSQRQAVPETDERELRHALQTNLHQIIGFAELCIDDLDAATRRKKLTELIGMARELSLRIMRDQG